MILGLAHSQFFIVVCQPRRAPTKVLEKRLGIYPLGIGGVPSLRSEILGSEMRWRGVGDELGEEREARPLTKGKQILVQSG